MTVTRRLSVRPALSLLATTALALTPVTVLLTSSTSATAASTAASFTCPTPGDMPGIGNSPVFTDQNVAVFTGGDYTSAGHAAESEGVLVVTGDASFTRDGLVNIGSVGVGSGIVPDGGSVMLRVGDDLSLDTSSFLTIGHGLTGGGSANVGGTVSNLVNVELNGGTLTSGLGAAAALGAYANYTTEIADASTSLTATAATGTVTRSGKQLLLTGTGDTDMEVFTISAQDLSGASEFYFTGIANAEVPVLINVTGTNAVTINPTHLSVDGVRADDISSGLFGNTASQLMWNMTSVSAITLTDGGQFMGSILAPDATLDTTASTNGRLLLGDSITTHGQGNEHHNYPWVGASLTSCSIEEPTDPTDPTQPTDPTDPTQPTDPTDPTTPDEDETTPESVTPDDDSESTQPDSTDPNLPNTEGELPTTGSTAAPIALGALVLTAAGAGVLALRRRAALR